MDAPDDANAGCVGPESESAGKAAQCEGCPNKGACSSGTFSTPEAREESRARAESLRRSLDGVSHVVLVLSGKGGVGKSTVSSQICHALASSGYAVGLLDVDLCGPSAPRMVLGDAHRTSQVSRTASGAWIPVYSPVHPNLACMSISFLLQDSDSAVVWRGPRKNGLIQQFLTEVDWTGDTDGLDYLIVDTPPGTSDEHISTVQYLQKAGSVSGAIVVTTPEEVSLADVRKELNFCKKTNVPVIGLIENMGRYTTTMDSLDFLDPETGADVTSEVLEKLKEACPEVLRVAVSAEIFPAPKNGVGPEAMAAQFSIPYWGRLPLDPRLLECCEAGRTFVDEHPSSKAAKALASFCDRITSQLPVEEVMEEEE